MKICVVCSHGGHLTEAMRVAPAFSDFDWILVTHQSIFTKKLANQMSVRAYFIRDHGVRLLPINLLLYLIRVTFVALRVYIKDKPDVIFTTGAEIAIPFAFLSRLFAVKTIYLESVCRVRELSGTAKLIAPVCDVFLVQWESLARKCGQRAHFAGRVL